ncbi:MAG: Flp pilus assembly protein CpaB [Rhodobacteraceae bacterium]|nr:MAG: Flp pilus assembly protein CpaB [Paracoccaceae bacterium]
MRLVFGAVLIAGVGLAGLAAYQTHSYISQLQTRLAVAERNANTTEMVNVFVNANAMRHGQLLRRDDVRVAPFPVYAVPPGAYTDLEELFPNGAESRVVLRAMDPIEPILTTKLTEPGKQAGITSHLSPGKRAFTIPVNQTTGVAGFLRPGDVVDIFWTGRTRDSGEVTQLIQPQLRLIAVDQSADMDRTTNVTAARTVTVEASPEQAAALAQAQSSGRLSLALVGIGDTAEVGAIEMTQDRLLGIVREQQREADQKCHIRTRRGGELVVIEIPCTN